MRRATIPIGTFLRPGDYMIRADGRDAAKRYGIVIGSRDSHHSYEILLADGVKRWVSYDTLADLFEWEEVSESNSIPNYTSIL